MLYARKGGAFPMFLPDLLVVTPDKVRFSSVRSRLFIKDYVIILFSFIKKSCFSSLSLESTDWFRNMNSLERTALE